MLVSCWWCWVGAEAPVCYAVILKFERYPGEYREITVHSDSVRVDPLKADSGPPIERVNISDFEVGTDALFQGDNVANDLAGYVSGFHIDLSFKVGGGKSPRWSFIVNVSVC
jgi:hypothetical protein